MLRNAINRNSLGIAAAHVHCARSLAARNGKLATLFERYKLLIQDRPGEIKTGARIPPRGPSSAVGEHIQNVRARHDVECERRAQEQ